MSDESNAIELYSYHSLLITHYSSLLLYSVHSETKFVVEGVNVCAFA
jgi:hypothetical protein